MLLIARRYAKVINANMPPGASMLVCLACCLSCMFKGAEGQTTSSHHQQPWVPPASYGKWGVKPQGWDPAHLHRVECKQGKLVPRYPLFYRGYMHVHGTKGMSPASLHYFEHARPIHPPLVIDTYWHTLDELCNTMYHRMIPPFQEHLKKRLGGKPEITFFLTYVQDRLVPDCEADEDPEIDTCTMPGIFIADTDNPDSEILDGDDLKDLSTDLDNGRSDDLMIVRCEKDRLHPEDPTRGGYDDWYIVYVVYNVGETRQYRKIFYDQPEPVQGTLLNKCYDPADGIMEFLLTRAPEYFGTVDPLTYLTQERLIFGLNCSVVQQATWYTHNEKVRLNAYASTLVLHVQTDARNKKFEHITPKEGVTVQQYMMRIMREACTSDIEGHYIIDTAHWASNQSLVFNGPNPWKWEVLCNGIDTPKVNEWMYGVPMSEGLRGLYHTTDWKDPHGYELDLDLNLDGPFVWPFCDESDEGCWTFTQSVQLNRESPVPGVNNPSINKRGWYTWEGRGQVCATIVRVEREKDVVVPVKMNPNICKVPAVKIADLIVPQLASPWAVLLDTKFVLYTWRVTLTDFRVDMWDRRCGVYIKNQIYMLKGWLESGYSHHKSKRDLMDKALGAGGLGLGALNTMDLEVLRNKLGGLAQHVGEGVKTQLDINHVLENLQHDHIDATASLSEVMKQKFKGLVAGLVKQQEEVQLALSCTQVQSELSQDLKLMITSLHAGHFPINLRRQAERSVPKFAMTHEKWWLTQFHGCQNLTCTISSLVPVAGEEHQAYTVVNLGSVLSAGVVLLPRVNHDIMIYEEGEPRLLDTDGCWRKENVLLCQGQQNRIIRQQCWDEEGSCLMDAKEKMPSRMKYLGQGYWCWYQMENATSYAVYTFNCTQSGTLTRGVYCTTGPVLGVDLAQQKGRTPITPEKRLDIKPDTPVRLQKIPLGFGAELKGWLLDFGREDEIMKTLRASERQATVRLEHDREKLVQVSHALEQDAKVSWWESLFGYSPKASAFLNLMLHPVVVLIVLTCLLYIFQVLVFCKIKRLGAKMSKKQQKPRDVLVVVSQGEEYI
ncbi:uncharacterized protein [Hyperolius riggenbachi]|uniref:uncharacterized protein n=1 Tax=Hyperolius riggenbachi TaxID=752182 RepID=UPI0035A34016